MRLLILTQAVDTQDPVLGFFHTWIEEFSKKSDSVEVICLREGAHRLPGNVRVHSLGKESGVSHIKYLVRFYRYIWQLRNQYDAVFVHMNPEYVVLGGLLWRLWGKRIGLWYVHRQPSLILRLAALISNTVLTAAAQSISLRSSKVQVVGHGIDTAAFSALPLKVINSATPRIVSVGRITPIKNLDVIIEAIADMKTAGVHATLDLIGEPVYASDSEYERSLKQLARTRGVGEQVTFVGSVPNADMPARYAQYDLAINAAPTGGIDKAILEAMTTGTPVLVSNESFRDYLGELKDGCMFQENNVEDLSKKAMALVSSADISNVQKRLRALAQDKADVSKLVSRVVLALGGR